MIKHLRDSKGRYTPKTNWLMVAYGVCIITTMTAYLFRILPKPVQASVLPQETLPCVEWKPGHYDCSSPDMRAKWGKAQEGMIEALEEENEKLKGKPYSVSKYSRLDSCHNRQGDKCLTAGGRDVKEGWTVACPRSFALGTVVNIEGIGERVCDDRTAQWVEDKFGGTFDVFTEDYNDAVQFGRKTRNVVIAD